MLLIRVHYWQNVAMAVNTSTSAHSHSQNHTHSLRAAEIIRFLYSEPWYLSITESCSVEHPLRPLRSDIEPRASSVFLATRQFQ